MGRETKVGLIVGLGFIVLFGVILSSRAGTQGNADLPTGESLTHRTMAKSLGRDVDPFLKDSPIELPKEPAPGGDVPGGGRTETVEGPAGPVEEPMRAPDGIKPIETPPDAIERHGRLAFGPARIETPGREYEKLKPTEPEEPEPKPAREQRASEPSQPTYTVAKGDSFISIARKAYGPDGDRQWRRLWEANKKAVKDPDRLKVGQTLVVPMIPGLPAVAGKGAPAAERRSEPVAQAPAREPGPAEGRAAAESPLRALLTKASRDGIPSVTAEELGRLVGRGSDLSEAPAAVPQMYTVKAGDTYHSIGSRIYGDAKFGRLLYLKNQHLVPDETKLKIGQRILLLDGVEDDRT